MECFDPTAVKFTWFPLLVPRLTFSPAYSEVLHQNNPLQWESQVRHLEAKWGIA